MKAIIVSVDYADYLALTLPRNAPEFERVLVVTSPDDTSTLHVAASVRGVEVIMTDAFYWDGCAFNKGRAIELAFDVLGRDGWICHLDADIVLPRGAIANWQLRIPGRLYVPRRRICEDVADWAWRSDVFSDYPLAKEKEFVSGYCQVFHADDPVLKATPWYPTHWKHAGGSDTEFCDKWPEDQRIIAPFEVIHLGKPAANWHGRATPYLDGSVPEKAAERQQAMTEMYHLRASPDGKEDFSHEQL